MAKYDFRRESQCIVLANRFSLIRYQRKTIDIGIDRESNLGARVPNELLEISEILCNRFRSAREKPIRLEIYRKDFTTEPIEKLRHESAACSANAIERHAVLLRANSLYVDEWKGQHKLDVSIDRFGIMLDFPQLVPFRARNIALHHGAHLRCLS